MPNSFLLRICLWCVLATRQLRQVIGDDNIVVAAYLPEYRSYINVNNTALHLTDLILFSMSPGGDGNLGPCCLETHHFQQAREARAYKQQRRTDSQPLKLWLSIGGAGRSNFFGRVASFESTRKKFIQSIKEKVTLEQLDGVDFDWEVPQTPDNRRNFQLLLQEAYDELRIKAGILVSVALHARQTFPPEFYDHVNRVNLMAYDMIYDASGGHHATMTNMKNAVKMLEVAGCPTSKIVVGIPAYARHGTNPGDVKTYSELIDSMEKQGDADRNVITRRSDWEGYLFDSPRDVRRKVDFSMEEGCAGVFFWELGQDKQHEAFAPGGILLETASNHTRLRHGRPKSSSNEL